LIFSKKKRKKKENSKPNKTKFYKNKANI
jgi:hypothetical protein